MNFEGFKLRSAVFDSKYKLKKETISFDSRNNSNYSFLVFDIGHNALDIVGFFKYGDIILFSGPVENELHQLISGRTQSPSTLARVAYDRRFYLYEEKLDILVNDDEYSFKIDGVGPEAIKLTTQVTYDDIATSDRSLEVLLRNLIEDLYRRKLNDESFLKKVEKDWDDENRYNQKLDEAVSKEEAEKIRKRKELEEFLKKEI